MKKFVAGVTVGTMIIYDLGSFASDTIQAYIFPSTIKINGEKKELGSEYQILNVDGHAYVPLRYVTENRVLWLDTMMSVKRSLLPLEILIFKIKLNLHSFGDIVIDHYPRLIQK